ncbi:MULTISPECIES: acyl-CoA dehydrogenase C-terminal domain-containing protein [unclassified Rhizobium]|uniref:acyl-CoA dehydrogenase C-terminal domain-containing protein n=1 Tax=unclassified Rhizobium TaxID=2613769 RepID=UPI001C8301A4|nr:MULTISPECIES: acyl-CoA dehydrogenase C-terminal domain-containing protein [unclassified Rhizobium]MBX5159396.1 acyl-CoA dehydrogenase [Rhizobium sp. NZLR8]MBX5167690.1 acyl-CoA dehydrogenase [Rhizobium sp. NZLR4b]MBX5170848.1 acyl-CoA dehydrogenase [Rhizobium sp. NZLR1b]MBX5181626.1 acyl-CoA dehydrogenase [Rhizobium sp. NZLR5]MBX5188530.1 acyl-CoA dehydrogenase [Rhizobium sp. NZLR3b]
MPVYKAPVTDTLFVLNDVLGLERYNNLPGFADATPDMIEAILGEAGKVAEEALFPVNYSGDQEGCHRHDDASVSTPKGFKEAYKAYREGGWIGLAVPEEFGGQGLPYTLHTAVGEYTSAANMSLMMYPGLTQGAIAAILVHGSSEQKSTYLPKMVDGSWTGTMNLTEPHCGTDLGMLRTKAVPQADGSYRISGQKIFISAGEHDLADNIVHLVLARIEGAPEGTKGISLFIVPKFLVGKDGALGDRNAVSCGAIEHKMGIHANATCVMNYDEATGFLIGAENRGLNAMFVMMNEARLMVGLQGIAISEIAYQNAANYARDRIQGRSLSGPKAPDKKADPIIVHPDIRRTLMTIRAFNEGGRAFLLWTALKSDIAHRATDEKERQTADDILGLVTPILKGVMTDKGFDHAVMAQQVFGGHGYIEEHGMSQYVRDARIAMIYEGANGIQALDLVGRKLALNGGRAAMALFKEIGDFCEENRDNEKLSFFTKHLKKGLNDAQGATMWFMQNAMAKPDNAGAGSTDYMHLFGLVVLGYMWAKMAKAAEDGLASGDGTREDFLRNKLVTARFFMERIMPETALRKTRIEAGADTMMELAAEAF